MGSCITQKKNISTIKIINIQKDIQNTDQNDQQVLIQNTLPEKPQENQQVQKEKNEGEIDKNFKLSLLNNQILNQKKENTLNLNLRKSDINIEKATAIQIQLKECQNLAHFTLDLSESKISNTSLFWIGVGLSSCTNLIQLELILNQNNITCFEVKQLLQGAIICEQVNILKIHLEQNSNFLFSADIQDGFISLGKFRNLQKLDLNLRKCQIGDKGIKIIGDELKSCINITNLILNLSCQNRITDKGLIELCNGLSKNLKSLTLDFSDQNYIGDNGLCALGYTIENCFNLQIFIINLSQNWIFYRGAFGLFTKLRNHSRLTTLEINLEQNYVRSKGQKYVKVQSLKMIRLVNKNIKY
ncbi:hypothetical protein TTHERM_00187200 (macronuclear) [Tetrahymena thermophila SB210]|uniref:Kinase domain protein n=1 Tax=Tetrahymena thermophila (strain SB210) TaxID=312017 RepID=Q22SZ7_TETTS|nr:hypothetical protein TTHERM_00187200 [Tetrahymena thermophila SB210]EAR88641.2 hypothetical protein TTHERM_00187200 [Tetrahymena thermophila SB210]|eukprot:XP_001008886.2 hypothetical protein TTHERM_00187200 [Tetrahymena thermophila SB210]